MQGVYLCEVTQTRVYISFTSVATTDSISNYQLDSVLFSVVEFLMTDHLMTDHYGILIVTLDAFSGGNRKQNMLLISCS